MPKDEGTEAIEAMITDFNKFRDGTLTRGEIEAAWNRVKRTCGISDMTDEYKTALLTIANERDELKAALDEAIGALKLANKPLPYKGVNKE